MASAGARPLPKMAAGGPARRAARARGRSHTEPRGPALPGRRRRRRRLPGRSAKGSPEDGRPATASAEPAGEAPAAARRQERGGPRRPSPSSLHKVADRRPSKRLKCEKQSLVKSELKGLTCGNAALGETPKTSDGDRCSEDPADCNIIQQKKGESIPEMKKEKQEKEPNVSLKPRAVKSSSATPKPGSDENLHDHVCSEEESSCESVLSDGSSLEDGDLPKKPIQLDNGAFLDEDSNQPMPVDRFFGDVEFIQDLPPVALPSTTMSRREFRRLHFIAKEDEEEEEEDVV